VPDSNLLPLYLALASVVTILAVVSVILLIVFKQRQTKNRLERQRLAFQFNEDLLRTRLEVQEQAMQTLSREIHDGIGQELIMGRMQLATLKPHVVSEEGKRLLNDHLDILKKSVKNLRLLSHSLNTGLIERKGIEDALRTELERMHSFTSLKCEMIISGEYKDLSPETDLFLFRIAQECIQNVLKHAEASALTIYLDYGTGEIQLRIVDDGKGFPVNLPEGEGLGMTSMRQRADMLKGTLTVKNLETGGTEIRLIAPYN
jgi:hypothetical protein